jgi:hypothetical protein
MTEPILEIRKMSKEELVSQYKAMASAGHSCSTSLRMRGIAIRLEVVFDVLIDHSVCVPDATSNSKLVSLPISVIKGDYCYDWGTNSCSNFDNEGGRGSCNLRLGYLEESDEGYLKPDRCKDLLDIIA